MEKVRECGLKLTQEETDRITGDSQREGMLNGFVLRMWGHKDATGLKDGLVAGIGTRQGGRADTRQELGWKSR
jgi:hypothetical protein